MLTESKIAHYLAMTHWHGKHLAMLRNCHAAGGHESDLLVINEKRRVIDIEIKVSVSDFKADAKKSKWRDSISAYDAALRHDSIKTHHSHTRTFRGQPIKENWYTYHVNLSHPNKVWKHYFCMPASIWDESLIEHLPSKACGVMLIDEFEGRITGVGTIRPAKANPDFKALTNSEILNISRLMTLRMWSMSEKLENEKVKK